jgi:hypothetical protein
MRIQIPLKGSDLLITGSKILENKEGTMHGFGKGYWN